jgi:gliding motility-associated-like protein
VDLEVRVVPAGSGTVSLEGGQVVVTDFWSGGLEPVGPVDAWAQPQEHWVFDHWESTTTNPTPGPRVEQVIFDVETSDVLVAYFTPIEFALYIPNAFSPNNDGMNDAFLPLGESFDARSYRFRVFNRWGEVVFESDDPSRPWIGEHQGGGHFVPDGLYHYHITVQSVHEGTPKEYTGTVQVIR